MKHLLILATIMLTACASTVTTMSKFPEVPTQLLVACPPLKTIPTDTTVFSELTKTVTNNYAMYYECAIKQEAWAEWFNTQKKIYENLK